VIEVKKFSAETEGMGLPANYLVCFGFPFMALNIYAGITLPWGFVNLMTAPTLKWWSQRDSNPCFRRESAFSGFFH